MSGTNINVIHMFILSFANCVVLHNNDVYSFMLLLEINYYCYYYYHTANNVSNFGGDPVTQLNLINLIVCLCVCIRGHVAILLGA